MADLLHQLSVIGHRGACGYRPEHTLASYALAARLGADYLEPDLVSTADGALIARHAPTLGTTTDVAARAEFTERRTTKTIDGTEVAGEWFAEDFTLAEIKSLRAREPMPELRPANTAYDGQFEIPTLEEILELAGELSHELSRTVGIYPETKHPTYFSRLGLPLEPALIEALERCGCNRPDAAVCVQSFEVTNLAELAGSLAVPLIQLTSPAGSPYDAVVGSGPSYPEMHTPEGLARIASYAAGIGPAKGSVLARAADGTLGAASSLVAEAHRAGLAVHPYTFRAENRFLPAELRSRAGEAAAGDGGGGAGKTRAGEAGAGDGGAGKTRAGETRAGDGGAGETGAGPGSLGDGALGDLAGEITAFLNAGIDGLFTDHPDIAARVVRVR